MKEYGIWDPYAVKAQTIKTAIEVNYFYFLFFFFFFFFFFLFNLNTNLYII